MKLRSPTLPELPFTTLNFAPKGGGIDFLGLRLVNLRILARDLLPGINNTTRDLGTFLLGAWLPWKFAQICRGRQDYTEENYQRFREAAEITISQCQRDDSPASQRFGLPSRRIGVDQELGASGDLRFADVARTSATSIFAAPLYGPALRSLGLHDGFAMAERGGATKIHSPGDDADTSAMIAHVDSHLEKSPHVGQLCRLGKIALTPEMMDDLGDHGLHPSFYRKAPDLVKQAFARKLLPASEPGEIANARTLTAALLLQTVCQCPGLHPDELHAVWHTGLVEPGVALQIHGTQTQRQRELWSLFQSRQYQRYCLELFMHCFEDGLQNGCLSVRMVAERAVQQWHEHSGGEIRTFADLIQFEAEAASLSGDLEQLSAKWNELVTGRSDHADWMDEQTAGSVINRALTMLARWHLRTFALIASFRERQHKQVYWDGADRVSLDWFSRWLRERETFPFAQFLQDLFSQLVFAQHLRVALVRFDGVVQRLRFTLGDQGIIRTAAVAGQKPLAPSWMADRLDAFIQILCDLDALRRDSQGSIWEGSHVELVPTVDP